MCSGATADSLLLPLPSYPILLHPLLPLHLAHPPFSPIPFLSSHLLHISLFLSFLLPSLYSSPHPSLLYTPSLLLPSLPLLPATWSHATVYRRSCQKRRVNLTKKRCQLEQSMWWAGYSMSSSRFKSVLYNLNSTRICINCLVPLPLNMTNSAVLSILVGFRWNSSTTHACVHGCMWLNSIVRNCLWLISPFHHNMPFLLKIHTAHE